MSTRRVPQIVEVRMKEVKEVLERAKGSLKEQDYQLLNNLADSYAYLTAMLEDKATTIGRLRKLLFGSGSEKTKQVLGPDSGEGAGAPVAGAEDRAAPQGQDQQKKKRPGHGRQGATAYRGAKHIQVAHATLRPGDPCPKCLKGRLYALPPRLLVRLRGDAPVEATVHELARLRCSPCGAVFTADAPAEIGAEKYDATVASMIALLKYGNGLPFNRLEGLQRNLEIPLPASTQWDLVKDLAAQLDPVYRELIRQAAQGKVVHNDDTAMTILDLMGERRAEKEGSSEEDSGRHGVFTSGIVSTAEGRSIAIFFTGGQHAGENLEQVLAQRAAELGPPIQMCDALACNTSADFETIVANCLAHGRRKFVDVAAHFPAECRHVLNTLGAVYQNEAATKTQNLSPEERLRFHQAQSGPVMDELHQWMTRQIEERQVEPNSGLGEAIAYMQNHWEKLTVFLRTPGAPLDNNLCERALKKAILHRKNSLFYKTENGARVGDLFMSLIHTCQLCGANAFEYLSELRTHVEDVRGEPRNWMPWNYREALVGTRLA
jgi:transposase